MRSSLAIDVECKTSKTAQFPNGSSASAIRIISSLILSFFTNTLHCAYLYFLTLMMMVANFDSTK